MSGDSKVEHPADRLARIQAERAEPEPTPCIYMVLAQKTPELGLTSAKTISFGYSLVRVYEGGHDALAEELANGWEGDCLDRILLPEGGLAPGKYYTPVVVNPQRDWETNQVEDWDVQLVEWDKPLPVQEPEA